MCGLGLRYADDDDDVYCSLRFPLIIYGVRFGKIRVWRTGENNINERSTNELV